MKDYGILASLWVCIATSLSLLVMLYKPAEDGLPPFRPRKQGDGAVTPRFGRAVRPALHPPGTMIVELSDGRAFMLPAVGDACRPTRFELLLQAH
jgi:hypothetical protein